MKQMVVQNGILTLYVVFCYCYTGCYIHIVFSTYIWKIEYYVYMKSCMLLHVNGMIKIFQFGVIFSSFTTAIQHTEHICSPIPSIGMLFVSLLIFFALSKRENGILNTLWGFILTSKHTSTGIPLCMVFGWLSSVDVCTRISSKNVNGLHNSLVNEARSLGCCVLLLLVW